MIRYFIGIDVGTNTGVAVWDKYEKRFVEVVTTTILKAMDIVKKYEIRDSIQVRLEDARKRTWFGDSGPERLQGAGSVKRDCVIWEEFLNDRKIPYMLVAYNFSYRKIICRLDTRNSLTAKLHHFTKDG